MQSYIKITFNMQTKEEILKGCTIDGNIVKLPAGQLDRKLYQDVAKSLELIGGKWKGHKIMGFVFPNDPSELLAQIANGEKRNLKKEFQFFGTPPTLAADLVQRADIQPADIICEPSAGQGAIIQAIHNAHPGHPVAYCELMPVNQTILLRQQADYTLFLNEDFLRATNLYNFFDKIIANPPFNNNQDIDHIIQMYLCCKPGGRIVTIASKHWQYSSNKKETQFREWLNEIDAEIEEVEAGTFKDSGTIIATCLITINKKD